MQMKFAKTIKKILVKKIPGKALLILFFVVICLNPLWWSILKTHVDTENHENRELAQRPDFNFETAEEYPKLFEDYYNDNMPFRNQLVSMNSTVDYYVFDQEVSGPVVRGQSNWLFYDSGGDGDPIGSYLGNNLFTDEQVQAIGEKYIEMDTYLREQGKEFVLFIVPNKERAMYEYMPQAYGPPADNYRVKQIIDYLKENSSVRVVYAYDDLMEAKEIAKKRKMGEIFYRTGTHWNCLGAYAGARSLLRELGIDMPSLADESLRIIPGENEDRELMDMAGLTNLKVYDDPKNEVVGYDTHNMEQVTFDFDTVYHITAQNVDKRKLYIRRDSFAEQMAKYVGSQFNESYMRYWLSYTPEDYREQDPDIFVYETVERYIERVLEFPGF